MHYTVQKKRHTQTMCTKNSIKYELWKATISLYAKQNYKNRHEIPWATAWNDPVWDNVFFKTGDNFFEFL